MQKIYVVVSYTDTIPGKIIHFRATFKFWNRYKGDGYSHVSLSLDSSLKYMMSFARRKIHNPFNAGLVIENIKKDMFVRKPEICKIAVMEICVSENVYKKVQKRMQRDWERRNELEFNFLGIITMLLVSKGCALANRYFCSHWVSEVLKECGIDLFPTKKVYDVRPFDFYDVLNDCIIYEGLASQYKEKNRCYDGL